MASKNVWNGPAYQALQAVRLFKNYFLSQSLINYGWCRATVISGIAELDDNVEPSDYDQPSEAASAAATIPEDLPETETNPAEQEVEPEPARKGAPTNTAAQAAPANVNTDKRNKNKKNEQAST